MLHGLESDLGEEASQELDPSGKHTTFLAADLADARARTGIVDQAIATFGQLDVLINNAGMVSTGNIENTDESRFDSFINVNVKAPFFLIQSALPHLKKTRGCIINIGSINAYAGEPELLPYSISKGGLQTLTRNLGDTLHRQCGVRVNQVNPGWVLTENEAARKKEQGMSDDWPAHLPDMFAPSGRILSPEEIAAAVLYFAGDESGPVSGSVLDIEQYPLIGRNLPKC